MITPKNHTAKAVQPNGSLDNSSCGSNATCNGMLGPIRRRLRSIIASPRWYLVMLVCTMHFVGSSASADGSVEPSASRSPKAARPSGEAPPSATEEQKDHEEES